MKYTTYKMPRLSPGESEAPYALAVDPRHQEYDARGPTVRPWWDDCESKGGIMSMLRRIAMIGAALVAIAACAPRAEDTSAVVAAIKAEAANWAKAYNAGDAETVASLYAEDAIMLAPGIPTLVGRDAIREFIKSDIASSKNAGLVVKVGDFDGVGVAGDLAWKSGALSVTDASGNVLDTQKYVSVYRRTNGKLQMIRDIWNSDTTPAAAGAPATSSAAAPN